MALSDEKERFNEERESDTSPGSDTRSRVTTGTTAGTKGGAEGHKARLPMFDMGPGEGPEGAAEGATEGATAAAHGGEPTSEEHSAMCPRRLAGS